MAIGLVTGKQKQFTPEMFELLRKDRCINAKLYNHKGQVLIYPKMGASEAEMEKLYNFIGAGVYFNSDEEELLLGTVSKPAYQENLEDLELEGSCTQDGLSNIKLISKQTAEDLSREAIELFSDLKTNILLSSRSAPLRAKLKQVFQDFETHPEAMNGLVNILDLLGGMDMMPEPQKAVKRTVVAMALKTRGMKAQTNKDRLTFDLMVTDLMMSSLLCDVGFLRMKPLEASASPVEKENYKKTHPLYSYLLIAQDESLSPNVKFTVLSHHRPLLDNPMESNNYPDVLWLREKLKIFDKNFKNEETKDLVHRDVETQLSNLQKGIYYDEDISIVSLASSFAELTTASEGRPALSCEMAVRDIINRAFYVHPERIVKEFLDHISMSLCNNRKIIREKDFVILASYSADKSIIWEVGKVMASSRWQSRPVVICFATIKPVLRTDQDKNISSFEIDSVKLHFRPILVHLEAEFQRRIVYLLHPQEDDRLYVRLNFLFKSVKVPADMWENPH